MANAEPQILLDIMAARQKVIEFFPQTILLGSNRFREFATNPRTKSLFDYCAKPEHLAIGYRGKFLGLLVWEVPDAPDLLLILPRMTGIEQTYRLSPAFDSPEPVKPN